MSKTLTDLFLKEIKTIDTFIEDYFAASNSQFASLNNYFDSVRYSVNSGGKRFRPLLSLLTAKALGEGVDRVLPFAAAVEFVHTYSLIHDDLPCMDDDKERRGKKTNHVVYGEDIALLAGDGLLTESFNLISEAYRDDATTGLKLVQLLSSASGKDGMIAGQILDIADNEHSLAEMTRLHELKTGELIKVSVEGATVACGASPAEATALIEYATKLGFAFQLADDIEDFKESEEKGEVEKCNYVNLMGLDKTYAELKTVTATAIESLNTLSNIETSEETYELKQIAEFNFKRIEHYFAAASTATVVTNAATTGEKN